MRLLQCDDSGRFVLTEDLPSNDVPPYAILSHTWGCEEVTFGDLARAPIDWQYKAGFNKIKFCAEQARRDGLRYFWVDTCCIDKSNAVELQTAINSMFRWYHDSRRCYVHLVDVSVISASDTQLNQTQWEEAFRESRWFTRGWTLQELVAPKTVDFYSTQGAWLGNKWSLEPMIRDITGIPVNALRGTPLSEFPVTEREAWVRNRRTTYEEDMVYALLGIFGVYLLPNYGEGLENAQRRLREEVQKVTKGPRAKDFSVTFSLSTTSEIQHCVGRESEIAEMRRTLRSDGSRRVVALHGLGGIGKTQLAVAYAKWYRDEYSGVFWINVKDEASIRQSFASVARQILRQHPDATRLSTLDLQQNHEVVEAVKAWFSLPGNTRWLIVYDNYDNPFASGTNETGINIRGLFPTAYQGSIVITTRVSQTDEWHEIRVKKLESADSCLEILSDTSGRDGLRNDPDAISLAHKLDGLPLALATAGAFLKRTSFSLNDYCRLYETSWESLHTSAPALGSYQDRTLCSTWQLSYDRVHKQNPLAALLLRWWAYFDNEDIWFELLRRCRRDEDDPPWIGDLSNELDFNSAMGTLSDYGLVEPSAPALDTAMSRGYSIHSCLHSWAVHILNKEKDDHLAKVALECVASCVPSAEDGRAWIPYFAPSAADRQFWILQRRLLPHAAKSCAMIQDHQSLSRAFHQIGILYQRQGKYAEAKETYVRALQGKENALEPDDPLAVTTLHNLATLYAEEGSYTEAEEIFVRILKRRERTLVFDHPTTLATVYELGLLYEHQGKYTEAEEMYVRALRGFEKARGTKHPLTLNVVCGLGNLYTNQCKYIEAEKMYRRALQGYERMGGSEFRATVCTVHSLGIVYVHQGKHGEAKEMLIRAFQGYQMVVGSQNIGTYRPAIDITWSLGALAKSQGQLLEAQAYYQRAYHDLYTLLGPSHKDTIRLQNDLLDIDTRITGQLLVGTEVVVPTPTKAQKGKRTNGLRSPLGFREKSVL